MKVCCHRWRISAFSVKIVTSVHGIVCPTLDDDMADNASAISSSRPGSPTETDTPGPLEFQSNLARTAPYRFHWDAASRRPGPPSVSEGTESRADFLDIASRNDLMLSLTASNASLPHNWSSTQHGFNGKHCS